jgi:chemotaxis protein MotB
VSASKGGGGFGEEPEAHENHERYLITYADMITLLMALFIILFAMANVDLEKYRQFAAGAAAEVAGPALLAGPPGGSLNPMALTGGAGGPHVPTVAAGATTPPAASAAAEAAATAALDAAWQATVVADDVTAAVAALDRGDVEVHADARGLVVTLAADGVLFDSGSSSLRGDGPAIVDRLAAALGAEGQVVVEGHTDDVPVAPPSSNWELSAMRATAVLRRLVDAGVAPARLTAVGRADTVPLADNGTPEGRARNRRVELVLVTAAAGTTVSTAAPGAPAAPAAHAGEGAHAPDGHAAPPVIHLDLAAEAFADHGGGSAAPAPAPAAGGGGH